MTVTGTPVTVPTLESEFKIPMIAPDRLMQLRFKNAATGSPAYAAIRTKTFSATTGERHEVIFYPEPDTTDTVNYQYRIQPAILTSTNKYPRGGAAHAETILASILDIAKGTEESHTRFTELLKASVERDKEIITTQVEADPFHVFATGTDPTPYEDFQREIGEYLGHGRDSSGWTHSQAHDVDAIIFKGLQKFYMPPRVGTQSIAHQWTFMHPVTTLATVASDYDYDLPAAFGGMAGELTYEPQKGWQPITIISEGQIREFRQRDNANGLPRWGAIRPKVETGSTVQTFELLLHPPPDAVYTLTYAYNPIAIRLTAALPYPLGGPQFYETIRLSCLSVAEERKGGKETHYQERFMLALEASISVDQRMNTPEYLGYNGENYSPQAPHRVHNKYLNNVTVDGVLY